MAPETGKLIRSIKRTDSNPGEPGVRRKSLRETEDSQRMLSNFSRGLLNGFYTLTESGLVSYIAVIDAEQSLNNINPKKLLNSKWTAVTPQNRERHFMVTEVEFDENGALIHCLLEAVLTKRAETINWRELKNAEVWRQGWV